MTLDVPALTLVINTLKSLHSQPHETSKCSSFVPMLTLVLCEEISYIRHVAKRTPN